MTETAESESAAGRLRALLEAFRHDEASERVRRAHRAEDAESERAVARRWAQLGSAETADLLERATLSEVERGALGAHLARARADLELADARDELDRALGEVLSADRESLAPPAVLAAVMSSDDPLRRATLLRALAERAEVLGPTLVAARAEADEAGLAVLRAGPRPPDAGPPSSDLATHARSFLGLTAALGREAWSFALGRAEAAGRRPTLADLVHALRFRVLDGHVRAEGRARRFGRGLAALGLERDLAARVRVSEGASGLLPRARVVAPAVPTDVRVLLPHAEHGLLSELATTEALGRALALALASPALPFELRRPVAGSVARSYGVLFAALWADRRELVRARELTEREADGVARRSATLLVLESRLHAAAVVARASGSSAEERAALATELISEALFTDVDRALASLVALTPAALGPRLRARFGGLALSVALRERYDEDWPANPRAGEPIRSMAARGGALSVEDAVSELGVAATPEAAAARLAELFG